MQNVTFSLMLDSVQHTEKPSDVVRIRTRLHSAQPVTLTLDSLRKAIEQGQTFCPGVTVGHSDNAHWQRQQVFALDADNQSGVGANKRALNTDEGYLSPEDALRIFEEYGAQPALAYYSFSDGHNAPEPWARYRLVFVLDREITDRHEQEQLAAWLVGLFGAAADTCCKEPARLFYGGRRGCVFRCEPVVCDTDALLRLAEQADIERQIAEIEAETERKASSERRAPLPGYDPREYDADPEQLLAMIDPNRLSYPAWRGVCSAFKAGGGSRDSWLDWYSRYDSDDPEEDVELFDGINRGSDHPTSSGTLKYYAREHSPEEYRQYMDALIRQDTAAPQPLAAAPFLQNFGADSALNQAVCFFNTLSFSLHETNTGHRVKTAMLAACFETCRAETGRFRKVAYTLLREWNVGAFYQQVIVLVLFFRLLLSHGCCRDRKLLRAAQGDVVICK
ncbi:MAG: hypothetical protein IJ060_08170 [Oscillospiraceae bacterium]|nr:hypothetical protein [Oscillospiraceae bacterium]